MKIGNGMKITKSLFSLKNLITIIVSFILSISLVLILIIFSIGIFLILIQREMITFINPNRVHFPKSKIIYDYYELTYRNHSLYRSSSSKLLALSSSSNEEFPTISYRSEERDDEMIVLNAVRHSDDEFSVSMEGICECYYDNDYFDEERRVSNVIYSARYSGIVIVSVLGYAVSKFVNEYIDQCYTDAKEVVGDSNLPFTCALKRSKGLKYLTQIEGVFEDLDDAEMEDHRRYVCKGRCVTRDDIDIPKLYDEDSEFPGIAIKDTKNYRIKESILEMDCDHKWAEVQQVFVTPPERPTKGLFLKAAKNKYRDLYLRTFCETFKYQIKEDGKFEDVRACNSNDGKLHNIMCFIDPPDQTV